MSNVRRSRMESGLGWRTCVVVLFVTMVAIFWPQPAFNQQVSGTITGFVSDQTGAAIPGAAVTVTNVLTGVSTQRTSETSGLYVFTNLIPGTYSVTVVAQGFQKFVRENAVLSVDSTLSVDAHMQLGQVTQEVTVTGAAPLLNVQKADVSTTLPSKAIADLPTISRNISSLVVLVPGVTQNSYQQGFAEDPANGFQATANGMFWGNNNYQLDGILDTEDGLSGYEIVIPPADGVQEMKVTTDNYDAELGQVAGMVVQYSTKSGTNQFHGSLYESNENKATFAANPYTEKIPGTGPKGLGTGPSPFNQNTFGGSLGGPILRDKLFFFADYQGGRLAQSAAELTTVPISNFQTGNLNSALGSVLCFNPANPSSNGACGGSFSSALMVPTTEGGTIQARQNMVFDPTTGNPDGTGRSAFTVGGVPNMIPGGRLNQVSKNLMGLLGQNLGHGFWNQSLSDLNFSGTVPGAYSTNQVDMRVDSNISEKNRFFGRYTYFTSLMSNPSIFGLAGGPSAIGWDGEIGHYHDQLGALNFTHTFSPTLMAEFRFGVSRFWLYGLQSDSGNATDDQVGILGINTKDPLYGGLAGITVAGPTGGFHMGMPSGQGLPRWDARTNWEWVTNWNKIKGKHELRWGFDAIRIQETFLTVNESSRGNFNFSQTISSDNGIPGTGLGMGTFLLGMPSEYDRAVFETEPADRATKMAGYIEDTFRASPKLTFNLGLRYDFIGQARPAQKGGGVTFNIPSGDLILCGVGDIPVTCDQKNNYRNFEPRVGFAYRVTNDTVVRGGFGRSYFYSNYGGGLAMLLVSYPIQTREDVNQVNEYFPIQIPPETNGFVFNPSQPLPPTPLPVLPSSGRIPLPAGLGAYALDFSPNNSIDTWNFTVQHQFAPNLALSVAYVGNVGRHLFGAYDVNAAYPGPGPVSPRRPLYNQFGIDTPVVERCNCESSSYHSLQVSMNKRFNDGYSLFSSFTWQKALDYPYGGSGDPYDRDLSRAPDGNNRTVVWTIGHQWNLPYGKGLHWGANAAPWKEALMGGWVFNGITSLMSGLPVGIGWSDASSLNNGGDFGQRPDLVGNPKQNIPPGLWYNPKAFANPAPCTTLGGPACGYGNYDSTSIVGPSLATANWALWKQFSFKTPLSREDTTLQLRFESFNLFNRTNRTNPDGTANDATAGEITNVLGITTSGTSMRQFQFGLRLVF